MHPNAKAQQLAAKILDANVFESRTRALELFEQFIADFGERHPRVWQLRAILEDRNGRLETPAIPIRKHEIFTHESGFGAIYDGTTVRVLSCLPPEEAKTRRFKSWSAYRRVIPRREWVPFSNFEEVQWSLVRIRDQGIQSSCCGHGIVGAMESARRVRRDDPVADEVKLSPCCCYGQIQRGRDGGACVSDGIEKMISVGTTLESVIGSRDIDPIAWPADWKSQAIYKINGDSTYSCRSFDEIVSAVMGGMPVVFSVEVGGDFGELSAEGFAPSAVGRTGRHCMFALPFGLTRSAAEGWGIATVNSWGHNWGRKGICFLPESYFRKVVDAFAIAAL